MKLAGIPPRFQEAHISNNCGIYATVDGNRLAYSQGKEFAKAGKVKQRDQERVAFFLCGGFGVGKTWLATAIFKELLHRGNGGIWCKFYGLIREIQSCYNSGSKTTTDAVVNKYQHTPLLLIDDVGDMTVSTETEDRKRLLYEVIDTRNDYFLPTIITTNLSSNQLEKQFTERTFQRILEMSAIYKMDGDNMRL